MSHSFPDAYEAVTGETLPPGAPYKKDESAFRVRHADDWVVVSALNSDAHPGMVECHATRGGVRGGWKDGVETVVEEREFLVPRDEYRARSPHGFVVDETRHAYPAAPAP